jgi:hypothetical protein
MPILNDVETVDSKIIWQKGDRTIYEVELEYQGNPFKAKSYSDRVAAIGFTGDVEVYDKQGQRGSEQFVRQAPKENAAPASSGTSTAARPAYQPKDEKAIQAMWAISQAIALSTATVKENATLEHVYNNAAELFSMVDAVKNSDTKQAQLDIVQEVPEGPVSLDEIDALFKSDMDDKPWHPGSR